MKFSNLISDQDEYSIISTFYDCWQKFEERTNSYFSSKDIVVANFSNADCKKNYQFDTIPELIEAAYLILDKIAKQDEYSLAQRKIKHSIDFLEHRGPDRILRFLESEQTLFPAIDIDLLEKYHEAYLELEGQKPKIKSGMRLDGKKIRNILETKGRSLLVKMGFEELLQKYPFEVVEANSNDGWMALVCMEDSPKIFVQTNPNNNYPEDSGFLEILVHELAHYCHFATICDRRTKHRDPARDIFCLHGVDGFFIEGVAQYLTEVVFHEFDVTIEERAAKSFWELRSAVMYYNLYNLGQGLTRLDQAAEIHSRFLGSRKDLAKNYESLMHDRLMATQMFNYFASLAIIKNHAASKSFNSIFHKCLSITTPEQFMDLFAPSC